MKNIYIVLLVLIISCFTKPQENSADSGGETNSLTKYKDTTNFDYDSIMTSLKRVLADDFILKGHSCFLIVSNLSEKGTDDIIENTVKRAEQCFYNNFFEKTPASVIIIYLFKNDETYRYWAKKLYDDDDLSRFGYYKPSEKAMLMNINTGSGTLVHEMTHAFVRYDFPEIPSWFNEGLGSLYERCSLNGGEIIGYVNWRLPQLQDAINDGSYSPVKELIKTNYEEFYGENSGFNYAQARYLCYYLQEKKMLKEFYKMFRDRYAEDNTGGKFLEEITGMSLLDLDKEFVKFARKLKQ